MSGPMTPQQQNVAIANNYVNQPGAKERYAQDMQDIAAFEARPKGETPGWLSVKIGIARARAKEYQRHLAVLAAQPAAAR